MKQAAFLKRFPSAHGGALFTTVKARSRTRPLSTKHTMHLVLRSSKAKGAWSMRHAGNEGKIRQIIQRFSQKYGIELLKAANVGNHLHLQIKLANRHTYAPFIRAISAAIAMAVTETSRWKPLKKSAKDRFWDYRPFTRIMEGYKAALRLRDYIAVNQLEGLGWKRTEAHVFVAWQSSA